MSPATPPTVLPATPPISASQWGLLLILSMLWGGSFLFIALAVREVPPITIVLVRCALAALILVPIVYAIGHRLPSSLAGWQPFAVMAVLNNVIPFVLIVKGQSLIPSGLASVINSTTPLWAVLMAHLLTTDDRLGVRRLAGVMFGIAGVGVLVGPALGSGASSEVIGMLLVLVATFSYGFAGVWARRLRSTPPLVSAASQVVCSSLMLVPLSAAIEQPWTLPMPSTTAIGAIIALAVLSTAIAYVIFYRIIAVSGPSNAMLVTLLIPVSAMALGVVVLGEAITFNQVVGALIIASALLVIDGRVMGLLSPSRPQA